MFETLDNIIKYALFPGLLLAIYVNTIDPTVGHRAVQAVMAVSVLLCLFADWHFKRDTKKLNQKIEALRVELDDGNISVEEFEKRGIKEYEDDIKSGERKFCILAFSSIVIIISTLVLVLKLD